MTKILPLPVKKNKFGQRVADIPTNDYYGQIMEEVLEAHQAANNAEILKVMRDEGCGQCAEFIQTNEAEELVDVITCCVTRLEILDIVEKEEDELPLEDLIKDFPLNKMPENFIRELAQKVLNAHRAATKYDFAVTEFEGFTYAELEELNINELHALVEIIKLCVARLEHLGYDEDKRQEMYQAVNEKNRKRGYFED